MDYEEAASRFKASGGLDSGSLIIINNALTIQRDKSMELTCSMFSGILVIFLAFSVIWKMS